jgi:hypothetical protein
VARSQTVRCQRDQRRWSGHVVVRDIVPRRPPRVQLGPHHAIHGGRRAAMHGWCLAHRRGRMDVSCSPSQDRFLFSARQNRVQFSPRVVVGCGARRRGRFFAYCRDRPRTWSGKPLRRTAGVCAAQTREWRRRARPYRWRCVCRSRSCYSGGCC